MPTKDDVEVKLIPLATVSKMLSMSIPKLEEHEAAGDIEIRWSGNKRYVKPSEVDRLIESLPTEKRAS